jgi:LAO/AO transport system kinase
MNDDVARVLGGDQRAISRLMTSLERRDSAVSPAIKELDCKTGNAYTIGITGPPGVGKSTLVDRFTGHLRDQGLTVGIIAVDPDSPFSGGSILGDRIRMQRHYLDSGVFIRSVSTRGQAGGLPRIVKGMVRVLDAAGKDIILVETVGVGQTELGVMDVADTVIVALMPESGDAIQTLKAGILEIADIYLVNKSDREGADRMAAAMRAMLQTASEPQEWEPPVILTQAVQGLGIENLWEKVKEHRSYVSASAEDQGQPSLLEMRRSERRRAEFLESIQEELSHRLKARIENDPTLRLMLEDIAIGKREPFSTAAELLEHSDLAGFTFPSSEGESLS